jgi:hypothetical protein
MSIGLYIAVAVAWFVPDRRVERVLTSASRGSHWSQTGVDRPSVVEAFASGTTSSRAQVKSRIGSFDGRDRPAGVSPGHTSTAASPLQDSRAGE